MRAAVVSLPTLFVLFLLVSRAMAQGLATSFQAGVTPFDGAREFELGTRFSPRGPLGVDVSFDVYPKYLLLGALVGVADVALAGNLSLGSVATIQLRAGPSILGAAAPGGVIAGSGYGAGVGLVFTADARTTLRTDYTYRRILLGQEHYTFPSLRAGFLVHH